MGYGTWGIGVSFRSVRCVFTPSVLTASAMLVQMILGRFVLPEEIELVGGDELGFYPLAPRMVNQATRGDEPHIQIFAGAFWTAHAINPPGIVLTTRKA